MGRSRAVRERARAGLSVFLWEAAVVVATVVLAIGISALVLALV
jgi:hypothetical protein